MLKLCSLELSDQCLNFLAYGSRLRQKDWVCPVCMRLKKPEVIHVTILSFGYSSLHTTEEENVD